MLLNENQGRKLSCTGIFFSTGSRNLGRMGEMTCSLAGQLALLLPATVTTRPPTPALCPRPQSSHSALHRRRRREVPRQASAGGKVWSAPRPTSTTRTTTPPSPRGSSSCRPGRRWWRRPRSSYSRPSGSLGRRCENIVLGWRSLHEARFLLEWKDFLLFPFP